jgi:hypothetical protein
MRWTCRSSPGHRTRPPQGATALYREVVRPDRPVIQRADDEHAGPVGACGRRERPSGALARTAVATGEAVKRPPRRRAIFHRGGPAAGMALWLVAVVLR